MSAEGVGPVAALCGLLLDPRIAFGGLAAERDDALVGREIQQQAETLYATENWAALADEYKKASEEAWRAHLPARCLRLLLAERCAGERSGDPVRVGQATLFLAERHRLRGSFVAAESWLWSWSKEPESVANASLHARLWRSLAAIREVGSAYEDSLRFLDNGLGVCRRFSNAPEITGASIRLLLQKSSIERLRGFLPAARIAIEQARALAERNGVDDFTDGLLALREGSYQIIVGHWAEALSAYRHAAARFADRSDLNRRLAELRQVSCLRELGRLVEALALADELSQHFRSQGDKYRLGQVLLERAEVLQTLEDRVGVARDLEEARPFYEQASTLEALRWRRHMARYLISIGNAPVEAAEHLMALLAIAMDHGRRDVTRTMLALHDLLRLPQMDMLPPRLRFAVIRAAVLAADLQRDSLQDADDRWAMHGQREEIYASGVLAHADVADADAVAQIIETGRADVINQVLAASIPTLPALDGRITVVAPKRLLTQDEVFRVSAVVVEAISTGHCRPLFPVPDLPGELPPPASLDAMADVLVLAQLGQDAQGWWSSIATRERGQSWQVAVSSAPARIQTLLTRMAQGVVLPARGLSPAIWKDLSDFLLPAAEIWSGRPEEPRKVVIIPDPRLWHVPMGALMREGVRLIDVAQLTLAPSLQTLGLLRTRAALGQSGGGVTSRPVASLLDAGMVGGRVEQAALDAWPRGHHPLQTLADVDLAHGLLYVSGHAIEAGAASTLGPGEISLDQLASAALPALVILNGCWSGTATSKFGQDPLSLAVGCLLGGANTVLAGTGQVGSSASARVGALTLEYLAAGTAPAAALRRAQRQVRDANPGLSPYDWAGLCAVGTGD